MRPLANAPLTRTAGLGLLALSALALLVAPALMPADYDWLRHTTSESAAQGVPGAWLARLGFLLFGLSVTWLAGAGPSGWPQPARWLHLGFGVLMIATAAFSTRAWAPGAAYDPVETALHSFTATAMGFAFAIGVAWGLAAGRRSATQLVLDVTAVIAAVAIPLAMSALPAWTGLLQRGMFAVAYAWYGREWLRDREWLRADSHPNLV
ncbi:MAG: DUF998 domain-containing protein [Anaerolineales bacterium]|nr:DUF998 domain-containing protein [Anaerolineales bacterium]